MAVYPHNVLPMANGDIYRFCNPGLRVSRENRHLEDHRHILLAVIDETAYFAVCSSSTTSRDAALLYEPNGTVLDIVPDGHRVGNCLTLPTHINCNDIHSFPIGHLDDMHTDGVIDIMGGVDEEFYEKIKSSILFTEGQPDIYDSMTWGSTYP